MIWGECMNNKISNFIYGKLNFLKLINKNTNNPLEIILFRVKIKKRITIKTKQGINIIIPKNDVIKNKNWNNLDLLDFVMGSFNSIPNLKKENINIINNLIKQFINSNNTIDFDGLKFLNDPSSSVLAESISNNDYLSRINLNNANEKIILDVGANIGDSTLLFAKYYKKVLAFEPVPYNYEKLVKNIDLNPNYKDKIVTYNKAVSDKNEIIKINIAGTQSSVYLPSNDYCEIETIKIKDVLDDINDDGKLVLKMDCEGSEFDIVSNEDLTMFNEIIMECHSQITGLNKEIIGDKLKSGGFKIKYYPVPFEEDINKICIIHAFKN